MKKKHIYVGLTLLWMLVIFWFSAQVGDRSQGMSDAIIKLLEDMFQMNLLHTTSIAEEMISFLVRKAAHMGEYAILSILLCLTLQQYEQKQVFFKALSLALIYACSDEFHQLFVEERTGQIKDVGIDMLGVLIGLCIWQVAYQVMKRYRHKHT